MADQQVVLGIFADETAADAAVESLRAWGQMFEIDLPAVGVLVLDGRGHVKEHKLGPGSGGKGTGIGLVLAVVAPITLFAGAIGGGIVGHFHRRGLGLSTEDRERIGAELASGRAAVGVLAAAADASAISSKLTELGGTTETHEVTGEALEAAAAASSAEPEAPTTTA